MRADNDGRQSAAHAKLALVRRAVAQIIGRPVTLQLRSTQEQTNGARNPMSPLEQAYAAMLCHRRSAETRQGY